LRKTWRELGLGLLNLLLVVGAVVAMQPVLRKYLGSAGAAVLAALCLGVYIAAAKWIEQRTPTELAVSRALPELGAGIVAGLLRSSPR
jgi:branched-subunit amino acid transport protein